MNLEETAIREHLLAGASRGGRFRLRLPDRLLRGRAGTRAGKLRGASLDFSDFREYHPGDDLRAIDWNIFARTDRLTVKLYQEEVSPHVDIICDASRSMSLDGTRKAEAALGLAAFAAAAAGNAQCTHQAWGLGARPRPLAGGNSHPGLWQGFSFGGLENPAPGLLEAAAEFRRFGIRVLVSDLLWPCDAAAVVRRLADGAAALLVLHLLDDGEAVPPPRGRYRLVDAETGGTLDVLVDAGAAARYRASLERLCTAWEQACLETGAVYTRLTTTSALAGRPLPELERRGLLEVC